MDTKKALITGIFWTRWRLYDMIKEYEEMDR